jgi:hypothetical protein
MLKLLFQFLAAFNFVSLQIADGFLLPKSKLFAFNPINSVYLTAQTNQLLTIYFVLSFYSELTKNQNLRSNLNRFSGSLFSLGSFICFGYYGLVHGAKETALRIATVPYFGMFMVWMHAVSFIMVLGDLILLSCQGVELEIKRDLKYTTYYYCFYIFWSLILFSINKIWPYPFQNELNVIQTIIFDVSVLISILVIVSIGYFVNRIILKLFRTKKSE